MTPRIPLTRSLITGLAAVLALVLAGGCSTTYQEDWSGLPQQKAPKVDLVRYAHVVHFAAGSAHLEGREEAGLDDFLARVQAGPTDTVMVAGPGGDAALAVRRRDIVMAYLVHRGVQPRAGTEAPGTKAGGPDSVSVTIQRYTVTLPACPDWSGNPGHNWNNTVSRNWGCATATNLGLMVADPADLVSGRTPGPMDGAAAVLAIQRYRTGKTTPLAPEDVGTVEKQQKASSGSGGASSSSSSSGGTSQ